MARLAFDVEAFEFKALPHFGAAYVMARIAGSGNRSGFPLLISDGTDHVSGPPVSREDCMRALASENPSLPAPPEDARFVIAGQQPGLLTGPLYTFLKAVTAISVSARMRTRLNALVLPLFWNACEDHDVLEVNRVTVNGRQFVHEYRGEIARGRVPQVADISLADAREELLGFLRDTLPETEFRPWVLDIVSSADFSNYASAFSDLMRVLFSEWELRIVSPPSLRALAAPVLAGLVERWDEVQAAFARGCDDLKALGFEPPLDAVGLFEIVDGCRVPLDPVGDNARLAGEIRSRPGDFSPNAALRPILQDAVIPVVATVGGPSEVVYLRQIQRVYGVAGIVPSLVAPRISATFIEDKIRKAAAKMGLDGRRVFEAVRELETYEPAGGNFPEVDEFERKGCELMESLDKAAGKNPSRPVSRARGALSSQIERTALRLREEKLEASGAGRKRLEKIAEALAPGGRPQERVFNIVQFLNLYGPDFVRLAAETLEPFSPWHQAVFISTKKED